MFRTHVFPSCITLLIFALILQQQQQCATTSVQAAYRNPMKQQQQQPQQPQQPQQRYLYGNNYAQQQNVQDRQQQQQQQLELYSNRAMYGNQSQSGAGPSSWNNPRQNKQMHKINRDEAHGDNSKCNILVPCEAVAKYPLAEELHPNCTNLQQIEVCCAHYAPMRWHRKTICRPICENCRNGYCAAPGKCQCYEGFVANDNGDCVFTCPLGCLNGRCYLDGSCQCDPGYKLDETRKFCRPICSGGCGEVEGHNCTEPEVCGCAKGFRLSERACERICECGFGGRCPMRSDECECREGYKLKDGICQSECYQRCDNGICYRRNRCICNPRYEYHERTRLCIPK